MRACLTTHGNCYQIKDGPQASRTPRLNRDHCWQSLRKGLPLTLLILAAKAAHMQNQLDALTADRQVRRRTNIITMDAMRDLLTGWADRLWADSTRRNGQGGLTTRNLLEFKTR
jgi:hypothetical protein